MFEVGKKYRVQSEEYSLQDYWLAPLGEGDLAYTWEDKPHHLLYDLIAYAMYLEEKLENELNLEKGVG